MKKYIAFILALLLLCSALAGCGEKKPAANAAPKDPYAHLRDANMPKKLLVSDVENFRVATDDLTPAQRRQLCLDFFEMQLSFQWKTDMDLSFQMTNYKKGTYKDLKTGDLYGGMIYHSKGFADIYRFLEYYDETTGVLALSEFLADHGGFGEGAEVYDVETDANGNVTYQKYRSLMAFGNQCTSSSCWSWGRVINSVCFGDTCDLNVYNGFIPVGGYTYGYSSGGNYYGPLDIQTFGVKSATNPTGYDTPNVIRDWNETNGSDAMFKCYALMKPGDCLVDEGHALMVKSVNLYKSKDGSVVYDMSSVTVLEQIEAWHQETKQGETPLHNQGGVDRTYTFAQLQKDNYIPFTFREFLDENDPQDKLHLDYYNSYADKLVSLDKRYSVFAAGEETKSGAVEKAVTYCSYEGSSITAEDFGAMTVGANYAICDAYVTVTDAAGKVLLQNIWRADFTNYRELPMTAQKSDWERDEAGNVLPICNGLAELADGQNTVTVQLQLSTGEKLTAYAGTLNG